MKSPLVTQIINKLYMLPRFAVFKLLLVLSLSALIVAGCAATDESAPRASLSLEQTLDEAVKVDLGDSFAQAPMVVTFIDSNTDPANPIGTITITGLTNACFFPPCTFPATALGTLTITENINTFTIAGSEFSFSIPDVAGAQSTNVINQGDLTITNVDDDSTILLDIITEYSGQLVSDLVIAANGIDTLIPNASIRVDFATQDNNASASWDTANNTLIITGLYNSPDQTPSIEGTITVIHTSTLLPDGYFVQSVLFSDPIGENATNIDLSNSLIIAEGDGLTVTTNNEETYNVQIDFLANFVLADVLSAATAITLTDTPTPAPITTVDVANGTITITGITNDCPDYTSAIPCMEAGATALGDITITETSSVFYHTKRY